MVDNNTTARVEYEFHMIDYEASSSRFEFCSVSARACRIEAQMQHPKLAENPAPSYVATYEEVTDDSHCDNVCAALANIVKWAMAPPGPPYRSRRAGTKPLFSSAKLGGSCMM